MKENYINVTNGLPLQNIKQCFKSTLEKNMNEGKKQIKDHQP